MVVGLEATAERLQHGDEANVDYWARFDVAPYISRPFALSFLEFTPSARYRYTRYGASYGTSLDENGDEFTAIVGPPLDRSFYETQVEMRGPTFAKVWDTPGFAYSERFKHVIGPEVSWTYRSRVDDFNVDPQVRRQRLLPRDQPDQLLARAAFLRQAARPVRQARSPSSS